MTVLVSKPQINVREKLSELDHKVQYVQQQFYFSGDASETDFALPQGWEPFMVFDGGSLVREGSSNDYTVEYDGFIYTVVFGTAPASANDVTVIGVRA